MMAADKRGLAACVEAFLLLALAHGAIHCLPFRLTARQLQRWSAESDDPGGNGALTKEQRAGVTLVRWAVQTMARRHPLRPRCLARAMAARLMLSRRGIPSTLFLGLRRRGPRSRSEMLAHAWLRAGDLPVSGGRGKTWKVVGRFS